MEGVNDGDTEGVSVAAREELHGRFYIGSETNSVLHNGDIFKGKFLWSLVELHDRLYIDSETTSALWLRWQSIKRERGGAACAIVLMEEWVDGHVRWVVESPGEPPFFITKHWPQSDLFKYVHPLQVWLEVGAKLVMDQLSSGREVLLCCSTGFQWTRLVTARCAVSWWGMAAADVVAALQRAQPLLLCPWGEEMYHGPVPKGSKEERVVTEVVESSVWDVGGQRVIWEQPQ